MNISILLMLFSLFSGPQVQTPSAPAGGGQSSAPSLSISPFSTTGPIPLGFQLGPGDIVDLEVSTGNVDTSGSKLVTVGADGTMFVGFGLNKLVKVGGLTSTQVRDAITEEMRANFRNPVVQVVPVRIESRKVLLSGEVRFPNLYPITGATKLLDIVAGLGGFTAQSNLAEVSVFRSINGTVYNENVLEALLGITPENNLLLEPGDVIFVPSVQNVSNKTFVILEGRSIQLLQTSQKINLLEALARAGIQGSKLGEVQVMRLSPKDGLTEVSRVKFDDVYRKADLSVNIPLENGDIVFLPKTGMVRLTETMTSISPLLAVIRDTVLFQSIFKKNP